MDQASIFFLEKPLKIFENIWKWFDFLKCRTCLYFSNVGYCALSGKKNESKLVILPASYVRWFKIKVFVTDTVIWGKSFDLIICSLVMPWKPPKRGEYWCIYWNKSFNFSKSLTDRVTNSVMLHSDNSGL